MKTKTDWIQQADNALRRAAQRARDVAERTPHTAPCNEGRQDCDADASCRRFCAARGAACLRAKRSPEARHGGEREEFLAAEVSRSFHCDPIKTARVRQGCQVGNLDGCAGALDIVFQTVHGPERSGTAFETVGFSGHRLKTDLAILKQVKLSSRTKDTGGISWVSACEIFPKVANVITIRIDGSIGRIAYAQIVLEFRNHLANRRRRHRQRMRARPGKLVMRPARPCHLKPCNCQLARALDY